MDRAWGELDKEAEELERQAKAAEEEAKRCCIIEYQDYDLYKVPLLG